ncbi:hypothetical protein [Nannocystis radixulma]|uniref:Uncharacterized protein n=1 Tax=Nannocystis radixulma TaxID=2995305 RepID=A0ABT5B120_9BACT|nr:hypothetical protein [Nannocystis radixulma]MDC0667781.1 hypothetical protein [Nannocystis radixulma]
MNGSIDGVSGDSLLHVLHGSPHELTPGRYYVLFGQQKLDSPWAGYEPNPPRSARARSGVIFSLPFGPHRPPD